MSAIAPAHRPLVSRVVGGSLIVMGVPFESETQAARALGQVLRQVTGTAQRLRILSALVELKALVVPRG